MHVCVMDSHSSGMVEGRAVVGVGMSVSETRFLNKLSLDLVAIMVVKMAPYNIQQEVGKESGENA